MMGIQRYKALNGYGGDADLAKNEDGEIVLYTDHLAELHNLLSTLADIRAALGVGEKPMLSELAGIVRTRMGVIKILEREAGENASEVERLTGDRAEMEDARNILRSVAERTEALRDAAVRERDAACEAIRKSLLINDTPQEEARYYRIIRILRAALAKIEGDK